MAPAFPGDPGTPLGPPPPLGVAAGGLTLVTTRTNPRAGHRHVIELFGEQPLRLESGDTLGPITIVHECWGQANASRSNGVLLLHGFSDDSHAAGPAGPGHTTGGWWDGLIGPGRAIDTDRYCVVCPNVPGGCQGSSGPGSQAPDGRPWGSRFPALTIRDQVKAEVAFSDSLQIRRWQAVIGGSMGGIRAMEWAIGHPGGGPRAGLDLARRMARRTYGGLDDGDVFLDRFDANSYSVLTQAMAGHDVGRGRGVGELRPALPAPQPAGATGDRWAHPLHLHRQPPRPRRVPGGRGSAGIDPAAVAGLTPAGQGTGEERQRRGSIGRAQRGKAQDKQRHPDQQGDHQEPDDQQQGRAMDHGRRSRINGHSHGWPQI